MELLKDLVNKSGKIKQVMIYSVILTLLSVLACSEDSTSSNQDNFTLVQYDAVNVVKSNSTKIYMHYMPWFESKDINGSWGIHWTMANRNPDVIDSDGRREIASHFYPLIGPYSSKDPDVIEYHLLLMKLCGIDGVLIDWYGSYSVNDYGKNLINSEALIDRLDETGLKFAIVYEEFTAEKVADKGQAATPIIAAQNDLAYLQNNYFTNGQHITIDNKPLLMTFGPRYFQQPSDWTQIFSQITNKPIFLTLMNESNEAGENAQGEFAWVVRNHLSALDMFYNRVYQMDYAMAAAYPGFYDYYVEGGWASQDIGWQIRYDGTTALSATLDKAAQSGLDMLQLITWNDFGEGTMLEPTIELGYSFLEKIQQFTGVSYDKSELEMVKRLYDFRKKYPDDEVRQLKLDQVFNYIVSLQIDKANELLESIE